MIPKLKWKVDPEPKGQYRSFRKRGWPTAEYPDGEVAAQLSCEESYSGEKARDGGHSPLVIRIADHSVNPWRWRTLMVRPTRLDVAKKLVLEALERHPHFVPKKDLPK